MTKITYTTDHPASHYGQPVAVDKNGNAYGPGDLILQAATHITGWEVVGDRSDGLRVRATGNGLAQCFCGPTPAQERKAWYRYLRQHKLMVEKRYPRDFANEFDLVLLPWDGKQSADDSKADAELLTRPYSGGEWYGSIREEQPDVDWDV